MHIARSRTPATVLRAPAVRAAAESLLARSRALHWLDCHRFPTADRVTECLAATAVNIFVHGTPRQLCDQGRDWIRCEHDLFVSKLRQHHRVPCNCHPAGVGALSNTSSESPLLHERPYFMDDPPSLRKHFEVLHCFQTSCTAGLRKL
eukprot:TRINITY_DN8914_c0_g1_i3.p1 TRINITY_DN8914_c0_g1~~TRINITY_DN8914_c0_g1_i3.p1  ORF type:complete len:148 (-),score=28.54 TRINITY_DN8914_c0_g1_i3:30-473(-)